MKYILELIEFLVGTIKDIFLAIIRKVNIFYFILALLILGYLNFDQVETLFDLLMSTFDTTTSATKIPGVNNGD